MAQELCAHLPSDVISAEDATWLQHSPYKFSSDSEADEADTTLNEAYLHAVQALRTGSSFCTNKSPQDWQKHRPLQQAHKVLSSDNTRVASMTLSAEQQHKKASEALEQQQQQQQRQQQEQIDPVVSSPQVLNPSQSRRNAAKAAAPLSTAADADAAAMPTDMLRSSGQAAASAMAEPSPPRHPSPLQMLTARSPIAHIIPAAEASQAAAEASKVAAETETQCAADAGAAAEIVLPCNPRITNVEQNRDPGVVPVTEDQATAQVTGNSALSVIIQQMAEALANAALQVINTKQQRQQQHQEQQHEQQQQQQIQSYAEGTSLVTAAMPGQLATEPATAAGPASQAAVSSAVAPGQTNAGSANGAVQSSGNADQLPRQLTKEMQKELVAHAEGKPLPPPRLGPPPPVRMGLPPPPPIVAVPPLPPAWGSQPYWEPGWPQPAWGMPPPARPGHWPGAPLAPLGPPPGGPLPPPPPPLMPSTAEPALLPGTHQQQSQASKRTRQTPRKKISLAAEEEMDALLEVAESELAQRGQRSRQNWKRANSVGSVDSNFDSDDAKAQQAAPSASQETNAQEGQSNEADQAGDQQQPQRPSKGARKRVRQLQNRAAKLADSAQAAFLTASGKPVPAPAAAPSSKTVKRRNSRKRAKKLRSS